MATQALPQIERFYVIYTYIQFPNFTSWNHPNGWNEEKLFLGLLVKTAVFGILGCFLIVDKRTRYILLPLDGI